ncbi:MAG: DUF4405 domain-containing protein [Thermoguttaceae bacterium]
MKKATFNAWVDAVAFMAMALLAATGVLIKFVLPPGSGHFSEIWGMDRHQWGDVHFCFAVTLAVAVVVHLCLHWRWVVATVQGRSESGSTWRVALAVVGLLILIGLVASPFLTAVELTGDAPHRGRAARLAEQSDPQTTPRTDQDADPLSAGLAERHTGEGTPQIDGTMSLREMERRTGVSAAVVLKEMGLPADVPLDERLGRLRKQYNFDMHALREVVAKHQKPQPSGNAR